jgi:ubiquinol-cytochrome c reductase iron-sulfur subunit
MTSSSEDHGCCGHCTCSSEQGDEKDGKNRREFLTYTAGAMGAVGVAAVAWPLIDSMNPAADTLALSTTEVDVSNVKEGESITAVWRGKPVFIRRRTAKEVEEARAVNVADLRDPETDQERFKQSVIDGKESQEWLVIVGVCTHLGCVPLGQKATDPHGDFDGWFCPCHGSQYDSSARIRKGPAPKNMQVPPYQFTDATHIKIG